jgi:GAF domain-containing protein
MDNRLLPRTFVALADTMVAGRDPIEFFHILTDRAAPLLRASAAGLLLAGADGHLRVVAASSEQTRLLELFQLQSDQGPCLDCFRSGHPVAATNLAASAQWPLFAEQAAGAGYHSVQALPMRLRNQTIGALNLFSSGTTGFRAADIRVGQAMADIATIGLLHERAQRDADMLTEQLQTALTSRIVIEQAKGKLAGRLRINPDAAFEMLRDYARSRNLKLSDVAQMFMTDRGTMSEIGKPAAPVRRPRR